MRRVENALAWLLTGLITVGAGRWVRGLFRPTKSNHDSNLW